MGAVAVVGVSGGNPGRGTRPAPAAVGCDARTGRREGQYPVRVGHHFGDRVAISRFTFEMGDPKHLGHLLNAVRNVEGVYDVYRVTSAA